MTQALVFFNSNRACDCAADQMSKRDITISVLHDELDQKERDLTMREFRSGASRVLLTTDVISRGIDVQQVQMVINYDLASVPATYLHRAGHTARLIASRRGVVINFVTQGAEHAMRDVEGHLDLVIEEMPMDVADLL